MNVRTKSNDKLYSYLILGLQLVFSSWSWLFLFFSAFSLSDVKYGGLISAILFLTNSAVRVIGGRYFSFITQNLQEQKRLHRAVIIKLVFLLALVFLPYIGSKPIWLIFWSLFVNCILVLDGYFSFHIKYIFADLSHISLMRYNALSNLGSRGSIAVVSILAFTIGKNNWNLLTEICFVLGISGLLASYLSVIYVKKRTDKIIKSKQKNSVSEEGSAQAAVLGAHFLFIVNLFFGSANLLLARAVPEYSLILSDGVNIITFFYVGFIFANIIGSLFDQIVSAFISWKSLIISYFIMAIAGSFFYSFCFYSYACFALAIIWGLVYGWSLSAFFSLISQQIRGNNQTDLFAKVDAEGRLGFIFSQIVTGFLLDALVDPLQLLQLFCVCALIGLVVLLFFYKNTLGIILNYEKSVR